MYIKELHIAAFGPLRDRDFTFDRGLNIIEGANESGKSAVAMFIKFIFYGLSSRGADAISEKQRYVNWTGSLASGHAICVFTEGDETKIIRIERTLNAKTDAEGKTKYSEKLRVLDHETSMPLHISGQPGDFFFGVPEAVFMGSAFASQEGDMKPDGTSLKESVENIICAADENINIKRAADALDKARIKLLHKNRTGGEIRELELRRDELERLMMDSKDTSARLIKAEISLSDVKENIESAISRREELEAAEAAIAVLSDEAKVQKAADLEEKLSEAKRELEAESARGTDEKFMSSLAVAVRDIERVEKQKAEVSRHTENIKANCGSDSERDPELDTAKAKKLRSSADKLFYGGSVLLVAGLVGIILTAALKFLGNTKFTAALIITAAVVLSGIGVMVASHIVRRRFYDILDFWNVEDEDELAGVSADIGGMYRDLESARLALASAELSAKEAEAVISSLAVKAGVPTAGVSTGALIKSLVKLGAESAQKKKALEAEASRIEGQLSETMASLGAVSREEILAKAEDIRQTEIGAIAASMTDEEKAEVSRELAFNRTKTENLRGRELDLERECAALRASASSPATAAEELESIKNEISKLQKTHDALILAGETLAIAGENIRSSVVPALTKEASDIMNRVTDGRYSALGISPSFDMNFRDNTFGTLELDYLSAGTKDMAYIALRLALVKALYEPSRRPPVIFDESLAALDEDRVRTAVGILEDESLQSFLFTCRTLEGSVSENATKTILHRS